MAKSTCGAIILAGGTGSRFQNGVPKQFMLLAGKPLFAHSLESFAAHPAITTVILVSHRDHMEKIEEYLRDRSVPISVTVVAGGEDRQESSRLGLEALDTGVDWVMIHDAARPFVAARTIDRLLESLNEHAAVGLAARATDTVVNVDAGHRLTKVLDRTVLRHMQTPQAFHSGIIRRAHALAKKNGITGMTDDCSLVHHFALAPVCIMESPRGNVKITYPEDMESAERRLRE